MKPENQHLYLMQNEHGSVKIGRSVDPERRRKSIQVEDCCKVQIVGVKENWGEFEEEIHVELESLGLRIDGEWFYGFPDARRWYLVMLDLCDDTIWPFDHNELDEAAWIEQFLVRREGRANSRFTGRFIAHLAAANAGDENWDLSIWRFFGPDDKLRYKNRPKGYWIIEGPSAGQPLPNYTRDIQAALSLWPSEKRPTTFSGSPIECCIEALKRFH